MCCREQSVEALHGASQCVGRPGALKGAAPGPCRQVLHAARLVAQPIDDGHGGKAGSGFCWCAEALRAAACSDLADEACLMQADALLRAGDLGAAGSILQVMICVALLIRSALSWSRTQNLALHACAAASVECPRSKEWFNPLL